jgi:glycerate-2-kinase
MAPRGIKVVLTAESAGLVVTRYDHVPPAYKAWPSRIEVVEAHHPVPDETGARAAQRIAQLICGGQMRIIALITHSA